MKALLKWVKAKWDEKSVLFFCFKFHAASSLIDHSISYITSLISLSPTWAVNFRSMCIWMTADSVHHQLKSTVIDWTILMLDIEELSRYCPTSWHASWIGVNGWYFLGYSQWNASNTPFEIFFEYFLDGKFDVQNEESNMINCPTTPSLLNCRGSDIIWR